MRGPVFGEEANHLQAKLIKEPAAYHSDSGIMSEENHPQMVDTVYKKKGPVVRTPVGAVRYLDATGLAKRIDICGPLVRCSAVCWVAGVNGVTLAVSARPWLFDSTNLR